MLRSGSLRRILTATILIIAAMGIAASPMLDHSYWSGHFNAGYSSGGDVMLYVANVGDVNDTGEIFVHRGGSRIFLDYATLDPGQGQHFVVENACVPYATLTLTVNGNQVDTKNC